MLTDACGGKEATVDEKPEHSDSLRIVERHVWGWLDNSATVPEHRIEKITIHHGGTEFADDKDPEQYLQGLQSWSRSDKGWIDIPYHFVIDLDGVVYAARPLKYPGDTNTSYDPTGHALIQVAGNYDNRQLSAAQLTAITQLVAMLAIQYGVSIGDIRGHKDYAPGETSCPGESIYQYLRDGTIAAGVTRLLSVP